MLSREETSIKNKEGIAMKYDGVKRPCVNCNNLIKWSHYTGGICGKCYLKKQHEKRKRLGRL